MKRIILLLALFPVFLFAQTPIPFSGLTPASTLTGTEIVPGVQTGSNRKISINQIATYIGGSTAIYQAASYEISKTASTYYANPRPGSGLAAFSGTDAYTVIQAAIDALTVIGGGTGSAGGKIHIAQGTYSLSNELLIRGWEANFNPSSSISIDGDGNSTIISQATSGKNGLVVKDAPTFSLTNIRIVCGGSARSALLLDNTGTNYERSSMKGYMNNVQAEASSSSYPAVYLKNFFYLTIGKLTASNGNNSAIICENASATVSYGNSDWGEILAFASTSSPHAGLKFISSGSSGGQGMGVMSIHHFECHSGYYGLYAESLSNVTFDIMDSEATTKPVYLVGGSGLGEITNIKILSGYLLVNGSNTAITTGLYSRECDIDVHISGGSTSIPVNDASDFRPPNKYRLKVESETSIANSIINRPSVTHIEYLAPSGLNLFYKIPDAVTVSDRSANNNSSAIANTKYVDTGLALKNRLAEFSGYTRLGLFSGNNISSGSGITAVGHSALGNITTGTNSTAFGASALLNSTGNENVAVGSNAGINFTSGFGNIAIGYRAGGNSSATTSTGSDNVLVGYQAGQSINGSVSRNVYIGTQAGNLSTSSSNVAIGYQALSTSTTGGGLAIGESALKLATGGFNTAIGNGAGTVLSTGTNNTMMGYSVGTAQTTGGNNVLVGYEAGKNNQTGSNNTVMGLQAGAGVASNSYSNATFMGKGAGGGNTTGGDNTFIGQSTGDNVTTGGRNIGIGSDIDMQSGTASNQINIGNLLKGQGASGTGTTSAGTLGIAIDATTTATLTLPVSTTAKVPLNIVEGPDPTSPQNGDIWVSSVDHNVKIRIGATTYTLTKTP